MVFPRRLTPSCILSGLLLASAIDTASAYEECHIPDIFITNARGEQTNLGGVAGKLIHQGQIENILDRKANPIWFCFSTETRQRINVSLNLPYRRQLRDVVPDIRLFDEHKKEVFSTSSDMGQGGDSRSAASLFDTDPMSDSHEGIRAGRYFLRISFDGANYGLKQMVVDPGGYLSAGQFGHYKGCPGAPQGHPVDTTRRAVAQASNWKSLDYLKKEVPLENLSKQMYYTGTDGNAQVKGYKFASWNTLGRNDKEHILKGLTDIYNVMILNLPCEKIGDYFIWPRVSAWNKKFPPTATPLEKAFSITERLDPKSGKWRRTYFVEAIVIRSDGSLMGKFKVLQEPTFIRVWRDGFAMDRKIEFRIPPK